MKNFKLIAIALVAMLGFSACEKDCNHDFIEHDFTQDIVGTWTILEEGQAEAMVINPDGSFEVTGVMKGGSLYESKGTIKVVNNKVSLVFEGDDEVTEGRLELVSGKSLSIVINDEYDVRLTYNYCKNDISDEIVGMWVCHNGLPGAENDMAIISYSEDGKMTMTAQASDFIAGDFVKQESEYKVIGDLVFKILPVEDVPEGITPYIVSRMIYTPNGTTLGDILTENQYVYSENGLVELTSSWLRVKESLNLTGKVYDYSASYVTNAKGIDEDFNITGCTFNMANIKAGDFDMMFRSVLFCVEFPNATTMKQYFRPNGIDGGFETPITVEGNKVTLDMSAGNPAFRKVDMYMYQDADDSQLHIYMPTSSFINYFANLEITTMLIEGKIDTTDTAAVEKVFADMDARVESINVSFVMKARK
jgi:hypothetical protein